jgi:outer membrane protein assembly factor BamA
LRRLGGAPLPIEIACGRRVRIKTRLICLVAIAIQPLGAPLRSQPAPQGSPPAVPPPAGAPAAQGPVPAAPQPPGQPIGESGFVVGDIRVEGLQRISEGTVFNYLPVNIGDHLDAQRIGEAMRALYATGFFRDVELRREGNILLVVVVERPSIA